MAQTVFLLFCVQIMCIYPAKWVLVATIAFFETGSLICGVAQNARQLIVGRTVSGMGAAGMCAYYCFFSRYGNGTYRISK
jgi:predicted MFS family arabinose efflux permease